MTNDFFAPVDNVTVTDRQQAERRLRDALQRGWIDTAEFEARLGRVIAAERLDQLAAAVDAPAPIDPAWPSRPGQPGPYALSGRPGAQGYPEPPLYGTVQSSGALRPYSDRPNVGLAVAAHLSPFLLWLIGPAAIWAISPQGSYARREAAKAFNWQLLAFVVGIVVGTIGSVLPGEGNPLAGLWFAAWAVITVIGAVKAGQGADWRNPVRSLVPWEVLPERNR